MALPLFLMLFGLHSGPPSRVGKGPSVSAARAIPVDISPEHATALLPVLGTEDFSTEDSPALPRVIEVRAVGLAKRWIDDLPLKFTAQDGGLRVALRVRGL